MKFERDLGRSQVLLDPSGLARWTKDVQSPGGRLTDSGPLSDPRIDALGLGEYGGQEIFLASTGFEERDIQSMNVVGSFCAIPTIEMLNINSGFITNPTTGQRAPIRGLPVSEAAIWATTNRFDKVNEAVGISGNPTAVISEGLMWGERLYKALEDQGAVMNVDVAAIQGIVTDSATGAFRYLRNAFRMINPTGSELTMFSDVDVMKELIRIRDELFQRYGLKVDPNDSYSLIYAGMYSQLYKNLIESRGFIQSAEVTAIYEPMNHATPEQGPKYEFNLSMLGKGSPDQYLQNGLNKNTGLIALANTMDPNGKIFRRYCPTPLLPNELNYREFNFNSFPVAPKLNRLAEVKDFKDLTLTDPSNLDLRANPVFLWAANLLPTTESLTLMAQMGSLTERFKAAKGEVKSRNGDRILIQSAIAAIKAECEVEMAGIAEQLERELKRQINLIFDIS